MKNWNDLSKEQQNQAIKRNLKNTVLLIIDGILKLDTPRQMKVDALLEHSSNLEVAVKRIMESQVGRELWKMAVTSSEDAIYNDLGMQITQNTLEEDFPLFV